MYSCMCAFVNETRSGLALLAQSLCHPQAHPQSPWNPLDAVTLVNNDGFRW